MLLIVAAASIFSWILTSNRVTEMVADAILGHTQNVVLVLLLINVVLLVVGFFMEPVAAITILTPGAAAGRRGARASTRCISGS